MVGIEFVGGLQVEERLERRDGGQRDGRRPDGEGGPLPGSPGAGGGPRKPARSAGTGTCTRWEGPSAARAAGPAGHGGERDAQ